MKKIKSLLLTVLLIVASLSGLTTVCQVLDTDNGASNDFLSKIVKKVIKIVKY